LHALDLSTGRLPGKPRRPGNHRAPVVSVRRSDQSGIIHALTATDGKFFGVRLGEAQSAPVVPKTESLAVCRHVMTGIDSSIYVFPRSQRISPILCPQTEPPIYKTLRHGTVLKLSFTDSDDRASAAIDKALDEAVRLDQVMCITKTTVTLSRMNRTHISGPRNSS